MVWVQLAHFGCHFDIAQVKLERHVYHLWLNDFRLSQVIQPAEKWITQVSVETLNLSLIHPHMVPALCPDKEAPRPVFCTITHSSTHN